MKHLVLVAMLLPQMANAYTAAEFMEDLVAFDNRQGFIELTHGTPIERWSATVLPDFTITLRTPTLDWILGEPLAALVFAMGDVSISETDGGLALSVPDFTGPIVQQSRGPEGDREANYPGDFTLHGLQLHITRTAETWVLRGKLAAFSTDLRTSYSYQFGTFSAQNVMLNLEIDRAGGAWNAGEVSAAQVQRSANYDRWNEPVEHSNWTEVVATFRGNDSTRLGDLLTSRWPFSSATVGQYTMSLFDEDTGQGRNMELSGVEWSAITVDGNPAVRFFADSVSLSRSYASGAVLSGTGQRMDTLITSVPRTLGWNQSPQHVIYTTLDAPEFSQTQAGAIDPPVHAIKLRVSRSASRFPQQLAVTTQDHFLIAQFTGDDMVLNSTTFYDTNISPSVALTALLEMTQDAAFVFVLQPWDWRGLRLYGALNILRPYHSLVDAPTSPFPELDALHAPRDGGARWVTWP